jgi:predicted nucleic acid-binding protein
VKNGGSSSRPPYVLDTSAILALLEDEAGADRVELILRHERVLLPFVVALELYYLSVQERGEDAAYKRYVMLRSLKAEYLDEMRETVLLTAGRLKALHPLSLADAIIAAFARCHSAVLVHKDPEYAVLAGDVQMEALPYKSKKS